MKKVTLACARKIAGYTQKGIAEKIGVGGKTMCDWETGKVAPRIDMLMMLCDMYEVDISELDLSNYHYRTTAERGGKRNA